MNIQAGKWNRNEEHRRTLKIRRARFPTPPHKPITKNDSIRANKQYGIISICPDFLESKPPIFNWKHS
uniref:Uncharacterized protein n=1 Tax=Daucus carota subsp. sativus TaxID=79200 RepID=A0A169W822_DAUCS